MPLLPAPPTGTPAIVVREGGYALTEPVYGCARYRDGSIIVVTYRVPPWAPQCAGPATYRNGPHTGGWKPVWSMPDRLRQFIAGNPVGVVGKVSNRHVEIVDHAVVIPSGVITLSRDGETWCGY